jgi:hypothetical protein
LFCSGASFAALTATEIQKLVGSEVLPTDLFGDEVALEGDTILVGAPKSDEYGEDSGAAYVFTRDPATGVWTEEASLTPLDTSPSPRLYLFGRSVALFGDTALVGSELPRAAYVFIRDALSGIWIQEAKLSTTDDDYTFSQSVALSDDTALIGAPAADMDTRFGAAYVFTRDPTTGVWTETAKLTASDGGEGDEFGKSVALDGDTALVGQVPYSDITSGSAYVFTRDPTTGVWAEETRLTPDFAIAGDRVGYSVALDDFTALIGVPHDADNGFQSGAAYVFTRDPTTGVWTEAAKLTASDGETLDYFGFSVALDGDIALVRAFSDAVGGSAYLFRRELLSDEWPEQTVLRPSDPMASGYFGRSVPLEGDTALIGAPRTTNATDDLGAAYLFEIMEDPDSDGDGYIDTADNCPDVPNPDQADNEGDGLGDVCDNDDDNDGVEDGEDNCPLDANTDQADNEGDGLGDACDSDDDNDGLEDGADNCSLIANQDQENYDGDEQGDVCDPDDDNDGILDINDPFPMSDTNPTVVINSCDSGVVNQIEGGASFNDLIGQCAAQTSNPGRLLKCVTALATDWLQAALITGEKLARLVNAAAGVNCPP